MNCEEAGALLVGYVLGELPKSVAGEVEKHLSGGCPRCKGELAIAQGRLAQLAAILPEGALDREIRRRVLTRAAETVASGQGAGRANDGRQTWWRAMAGAVVGAGIVLGVLLAVVLPEVQARGTQIGQLHQKIGQQARVIEHFSQHMKQQSDELGTLWQKVSETSEGISVLGSPHLRIMTLERRTAGRGAWGRILADPDRGEWYLMVRALPPAGRAHVYEFWFIVEGGKKIRGGTFHVSQRGRATLIVQMPEGVAEVRGAIVTCEPGQGATEPRGPVALAAKFN